MTKRFALIDLTFSSLFAVKAVEEAVENEPLKWLKVKEGNTHTHTAPPRVFIEKEKEKKRITFEM